MTDSPVSDTTDPGMRPIPSPKAILAVVGFSVFVAADDLTVVSTMLRPIIGDLGLRLPEGLDDAAWVVNAYLIAFVAVMPLAGRLSDVIGRRRTFIGAYLIFLLGSIVIPLSTSFDEPFGWFLFGRVLTAIGGGAMVPVALAVVSDVYPVRERARALGTLGAIETMGWVWGPLYGAMLVRFLSWQWQFWLNIPLAAIGLAASWWALEGQDRPAVRPSIDWLGALLLTTTLVSLNVALLGSAEIQSVSGLQDLTGGGTDTRWLYGVALIGLIAFVWHERQATDPLLSPSLFRSRNLQVALAVNFIVGAGLVIAMVDVPLFVNAIEVDLKRSAVMAGWIMSSLTAAMALASYVGGRVTERTWYRPPLLVGLALSTGAFAWMGASWNADTSYPVFAVQLAMLGAGFGLTVAPTTSAVVNDAPPDQRGAAAGIVMVVRLLGFSVGLSALTAWGLNRFNALRSTIELPPIGSPTFQDELLVAQERLTAQAIAETFTASAVVVAIGLAITFAMRRPPLGETMTDETLTDHDQSNAPDREPKGQRYEPDVSITSALAGEVTAINQLQDEDHHDYRYPDDEHDDDGDLLTTELVPAGAVLVGGTPLATSDAVDTLQRRVNVMIGLLGLLLVAAFATIALLFSRVGDARADAAAARAELAATQGDLERVEAGAALYASQITGFQEQLVALEPEISAGVQEAINGLREFGESTISFNVAINETIPVQTEVVIRRTVEVPIKTSIPINETFETTIEVATPLGFSVPLDVTVPVDIEVPVDLVVDIPIDETIPIDDEFTVDLDVPISIDVGETELANLTESIAAGLESLQDMLNGLSG
jgi:EmrB/QacA subfamily drug resistance transporter